MKNSPESIFRATTAVIAMALIPSAAWAASPVSKSDAVLPAAAGTLAEDPLQIIISLNEQRLRVYRGDAIVVESKISSGKRGHSTPTGIFSILHKKRRHFSNLYNNAPMPYMQRLTWTGIALHGSNSVPAYPASHGCVRLPRGFDSKLFAMTRAGGHVIISGAFAAPRPVSHPLLPQPEPVYRFDPLSDHWRVRLRAGGTFAANPAPLVSTAALLAPVREAISRSVIAAKESSEPLRVLISRRTRAEIASDIQRLLNQLGFDAGAVDGAIGPDSRAAIRRFQAAHDLAETGVIDTVFTEALYKAAGLDKPANGKIAVRQDFQPVFEAAFALEDPEKPLGTHLLVTSRFDGDAGSTGWNAFTLRNSIGPASRALYGIDEAAGEEVSLAETLDRIALPDHLAKRIAAKLTPGSSIVIADNGTDRYTGWKTDFAVVTNDRATPPARTASRKQRATSRTQRATPARAQTTQRRQISTLPGVWLSR